MVTSVTDAITQAEHISHQHIAAVINTLLPEVKQNDSLQSIRILDLGCGDGKLLSHLLSSLSLLRPYLGFEVFGLDVTDAGQQNQGFIDQTVSLLSKEHPQVSWRDKLKLITTQQKWPYPAACFDFIVSNQVMEHVMDHDFVLREIARCLRSGGVSIHLFPIREVLWECHAHMPLVHRIRDLDRRARVIYLFAQLGFKRHFYRNKNRHGRKSLRDFANKCAQVLETDTNYITARQLRDTANRSGLLISFSYTKDFFNAKVLSYIGRRYYSYRDMGLAEQLWFRLFRRLASVTVLLRKST